MDIKKLVSELSNAICIGNLTGAADIAKKKLSAFAEVSDFGTAGVIGKIDKGAKYTLLLDAHIDEVGFIVTQVFSSGFLKVAAVGGIDPRILPASLVTVHGKEDIDAVFISTPPHLKKGEDEALALEDIYLDTGLGSALPSLVSIGDFVTFKADCKPLLKNKISGKALDDRAAVACLIEVASRIYDKALDVNVVFSLSEQEELGTRGAVTSSFSGDFDEAIAIDVSFGTQPSVSDTESGRLGGGVMIGISPILSKNMTDMLSAIAEKQNIPHQFEIMGGKTGTDADVISVSKIGIPSALLSIPLRNMHTPVEVIDTADLESLCDLLEAYILGGGTNA